MFLTHSLNGSDDAGVTTNFLKHLLLDGCAPGYFKLPDINFDLLLEPEFEEHSDILFSGELFGAYNDSDLLKYGIDPLEL